MPRTCETEGCERPVLAKGLCASCYNTRRAAAIRAERRAIERVCAYCGETYANRSPKAKFCSMSCKDKARYRRRPVKPKPIRTEPCAECGKPIGQRSPTAKFCSRQCLKRQFDREKRRKQNQALGRRCVVCDEPLSDLASGWRIYCSERCGHLVEKGRKYGVSGAELLAIEAQYDRCAICGTDEPGGKDKRLHVDHDHATGRIRGLVCNSCNIVLGHAQDDPARLRAAADYLERPLD